MSKRTAYKRAAGLFIFIIWPGPRAGKMTQLLYVDWLPEWARWSYLACSGLPAMSRKQISPKAIIDEACSVKMAGYCPRSFFCDFINT